MDHPGHDSLSGLSQPGQHGRVLGGHGHFLLADGPGTRTFGGACLPLQIWLWLNWEQEIVKNVGVFSRLGWNDDQEEGWVFSDVGYAGSLGLSIKGESWHRPDDTFGLAGCMSGISKAEQEFFAAGGTGILAGDGNLNYGWEKILETYYDFRVWKTVHFWRWITNSSPTRPSTRIADRCPSSARGCIGNFDAFLDTPVKPP
jgi:hypothetical protein